MFVCVALSASLGCDNELVHAEQPDGVRIELIFGGQHVGPSGRTTCFFRRDIIFGASCHGHEQANRLHRVAARSVATGLSNASGRMLDNDVLEDVAANHKPRNTGVTALGGTLRHSRRRGSISGRCVQQSGRSFGQTTVSRTESLVEDRNGLQTLLPRVSRHGQTLRQQRQQRGFLPAAMARTMRLSNKADQMTTTRVRGTTRGHTLRQDLERRQIVCNWNVAVVVIVMRLFGNHWRFHVMQLVAMLMAVAVFIQVRCSGAVQVGFRDAFAMLFHNVLYLFQHLIGNFGIQVALALGLGLGDGPAVLHEAKTKFWTFCQNVKWVKGLAEDDFDLRKRFARVSRDSRWCRRLRRHA